MKEGIHPEYNQTTITCACGNVLEVGSTKKEIRFCSSFHCIQNLNSVFLPFYLYIFNKIN